MKLSELGLKSKPQDYYTDHLIIKFKTDLDELSYRITLIRNKKFLTKGQWQKVTSKEHYEKILKMRAVEVQA